MHVKPSFSDLPPHLQSQFGNGCGTRLIPVPDFCFLASCRHHDFNFSRGNGANYWYENIWKAPYYYLKANTDFYIMMLADSYKWWHPFIATLYFLAVTLVSWPRFVTGRWRTVQEILIEDWKDKNMV